jgi:hypothetical protein
MTTERVYRGGRPRTQGHEDDPLVTVSLHVRKSQLVARATSVGSPAFTEETDHGHLFQ